MADSIGVIVPTYNAARFIRATLDRVRAQTRQPDEIIVVDDGSADHTAECVADWANENAVEIQLFQQPNGGASSARNAAVIASSSDLIASLDADDLIEPKHLEILSLGFEISPKIVLCFADASVHHGDKLIRASFIDGSDIAMMDFDEIAGLRVIKGSAYLGIVAGSRIPTSSTMYRRSSAIAAGLYDREMKQCNDRDFLMRLSREGQFAYFRDVINRHQRHDTNLTHPRHRLENRKFKVRVLKKVLRNQKAMELSPQEIDQTKAALKATADSVLYHAADRGFVTYFKTLVELNTSSSLFSMGRPRNFLRSLRKP